MKRSVVIVGCGTVGGATAVHLRSSAELIRERYGLELVLTAVVDRNLDHARSLGLDDSLLATNLTAVLQKREVDIVVELVGGIDAAFAIIAEALRAGKNAVTANKALLAHRGPELYAIAREHGVALAFEASCGGGIPLIRAITNGLAGNRIDAMFGIVNGTCNYILSEMNARGISYESALLEAQADGLAEADPSLDVGGHDSAHKIAILASLAFGVRVDYEKIPIVGIDALELLDVSWASRLGYVTKLLAIGERSETGITLRVSPCFVHDRHPLAWVSGPFNAVSVYSYPTGHTMYYGRGAGGSATAGAIVADLVAIANGSYAPIFAAEGLWPDLSRSVAQNGPGMVTGRFFLRAMVQDRPGVLAEISRRLGQQGISIASIHQDEIPEDGDALAPVVVVTHVALEDKLRKAVDEIDALPHTSGRCTVIPIIDEPAEQLIEH